MRIPTPLATRAVTSASTPKVKPLAKPRSRPAQNAARPDSAPRRTTTGSDRTPQRTSARTLTGESSFEPTRAPVVKGGESSPESISIGELGRDAMAIVQAAIQPGIRAWSDSENAAMPLRIEDDGSFLGALGQPVPSTADVDNIAGVLPSDGSKPIARAVFVNGVATTRGTAAYQMQQIADMTGTEVVGLYNATEGFLKDAVQTVGDRIDRGENLAVASLKNLITSKLAEGEPLRLVGYSQGAMITSRALEDAKQELLLRGLTLEEAEARMSLVQVETFGGAASHYPDGPQYVHHVNRWDPVTLFSLYALGSRRNPLVDPGRDAKVHTFNGFSWRPSTHSLAIYARHHQRYEALQPAANRIAEQRAA